LSQKIDDVLNVLEIIRKQYSLYKEDAFREARIRAIKEIAKRRLVAQQTIGDAYLRRLRPDIQDTAAFDRVAEDWVSGKSDHLWRILQRHALDKADEAKIQRFFA
jgi:hypothetical protein